VNEGIRFYSVVAIHHENYVKDHVGVGNGAGFVISNIGSYYLANKFSKFYMKNIFPSRYVSANLLFVSQFACDSDYYFEFFFFSTPRRHD
jgi:hypothetical protein